jgi:uncharacterized protein
MSVQLDRKLEPAPLAASGWSLECESPLEHWPRLRELAQVPGRKVSVKLAFRENEEGLPLMEGVLSVSLRGECQRCLEEFELVVRAEPRLAFASVGQLGAGALAAGFEACEPEPGATLRQLLEDELLLCVPAFPVHARSEECGPLAGKLAELEPETGGDSASSPFAALAALKQTD